ncbi:MAG: chorismate synthase [Synergistaceae bacterium]|jgi:chorismate synthase|nr:chorismate synthase [Synergistaceae bacterium]
MNVWGNRLKLSIFGESHGRAVGIVVDGLPPGEPIDMGAVELDMARRAPGRDDLSTARREPDTVEILSGLDSEGGTTGAPICGVIRNTDARSSDYGAQLRPGHADWTALMKFGGRADMRGGGHFSGRLTAPLVFAGSMAKQILLRRGVEIYGRVVSVGRVSAGCASPSIEEFRETAGLEFPASAEASDAMKESIREARGAGDSVGGVVEAAVFGLPGGLGEPFFASMESETASLLFSVPAVKGVEFGDGFRLASMRGSEANDPLYVEDGRILARSNHNGGVLGGITNGMPLIVRAAIKPTASIALEQESVDPASMEGTTVRVRGRHDPCIAPRVVPVVEACLALSSLDAMLAARQIRAQERER